ncbi:hypothetical protein [Pseudomonas extremaustralis]
MELVIFLGNFDKKHLPNRNILYSQVLNAMTVDPHSASVVAFAFPFFGNMSGKSVMSNPSSTEGRSFSICKEKRAIRQISTGLLKIFSKNIF